LDAQKRLAHHFYDQFCALLERGRAEGTLHFDETRITALAACSLPGFLYSWYRPDGRLPAEAVVQLLRQLACRVIGLAGV
ncbi:MAG: TetR family transcriptional regulator, partial [Burkholderiales bacterium PBB5]